MTDAPKPCSRCHDEPSGPGGIPAARMRSATNRPRFYQAFRLPSQ